MSLWNFKKKKKEVMKALAHQQFNKITTLKILIRLKKSRNLTQ